MNLKNNCRIGKIGEKLAVKYLKKQRYKIITTNFYTNRGEIDIVAKDGVEFVFIEVKTRCNENFGKPAEAVTYFKQKHMYQAAQYYIYKSNQNIKYIRFDVIELYIKNGKIRINHIKQIL